MLDAPRLGRWRDYLVGERAYMLDAPRLGRWRDYLVGERAYMLFSLIAKTILAWQVLAGTLRP